MHGSTDELQSVTSRKHWLLIICIELQCVCVCMCIGRETKGAGPAGDY